MKSLFAILAATVLFFSCKDQNNKTKDNTLESQADSLWKEVMHGHDVAMSKMRKLDQLKKETDRLVDSINTLPAKAREAAVPLRSKLDSLKQDLQKAEEGMNKWMEEFNIDSAANDVEKRIKYLADEKLKVNKMKEDVLNALEKADSLVRKKI